MPTQFKTLDSNFKDCSIKFRSKHSIVLFSAVFTTKFDGTDVIWKIEFFVIKQIFSQLGIYALEKVSQKDVFFENKISPTSYKNQVTSTQFNAVKKIYPCTWVLN